MFENEKEIRELRPNYEFAPYLYQMTSDAFDQKAEQELSLLIWYNVVKGLYTVRPTLSDIEGTDSNNTATVVNDSPLNFMFFEMDQMELDVTLSELLEFLPGTNFETNGITVDLATPIKQNFLRFLETQREGALKEQNLVVGIDFRHEFGEIKLSRWLGAFVEGESVGVLEEHINYDYYFVASQEDLMETLKENSFAANEQLAETIMDKLGLPTSD